MQTGGVHWLLAVALETIYSGSIEGGQSMPQKVIRDRRRIKRELCEGRRARRRRSREDRAWHEMGARPGIRNGD